jgi:outer membrane protein assembly factor BamA
MFTKFSHTVLALLAIILLAGCSIDKYIPSDGYYLKKVNVVSADESATKKMNLGGYVKQQPNTKWFGLKVPMRIYSSTKPESTGKGAKILRKIGEAPVIIDTTKVNNTITDMTKVLNNAGYLHSQVDTTMEVERRRAVLTYHVTPGDCYRIRSMRRTVQDSVLNIIINGADTANSLIQADTPLDINVLNNERKRITKNLRNSGYYKFNKEYITFVADTLIGSRYVDLTMNVALHQENAQTDPEPHPNFTINDITYLVDMNAEGTSDTIYHDGSRIIYKDKLRFRPNLLTSNTAFLKGELYNDEKQSQTYNNFTRLGAIAYSNIRLYPSEKQDSIDCDIIVNHALPQSVSFDIEGTNTAGDLGAAISTTYQHRNLFKGSETLSLKLRGAYEAITGLEGYEGNSYKEFGAEARLGFPGFLLPYISKRFGASHKATSEISMQFNYQDRPEFNRRVLTAAWRYRWQSLNQHFQNRFDLLEVNYINMPWISSTFREQYLDSIGKQNAILRYNYENLLITKMGFNFIYNSLGTSMISTYGKDALVVRGNIETSGNLLNAYTSIFGGHHDGQGHRTFCGIAYAQYVRGDFDISKSIVIDHNNSFAMHLGLGVAVPYGNTDVLPFEKRYFSGGANSVRGWSVRSLGPGGYNRHDNAINFINQSGDVKLDMSVEWRTFLFWKINGALFIDGGNIWTIRKYEDQPDGEFRFDKFLRQIAFSYGLGLRLSLDFFTLRFDAGMKAIDPAYHGNDHYPLLHPKFSRDFTFHFAVGLPF